MIVILKIFYYSHLSHLLYINICQGRSSYDCSIALFVTTLMLLPLKNGWIMNNKFFRKKLTRKKKHPMIQKMVDNTIQFTPLNNLQYYFDFRTMVVVINQTRKQVKDKLELQVGN